jgi:hypothetical protein
VIEDVHAWAGLEVVKMAAFDKTPGFKHAKQGLVAS